MLTGTNALIHYSYRGRQSAGQPEFPDQEAEEGVLHIIFQTGRADRKEQVSVKFSFFLLKFCGHTESFAFAISQLFIPSVQKASSTQAVGTDHVNTLHTASQSDLFSC